MLAVLNDILDFSKLEASEVKLEDVVFSPRDVIESVVSLLSARADEKDLKLTVTALASTPQWVRGDPTRLRQVLANLVSNAIKFTERGTVALGVGASDHGDDVLLRFEVRDTGVGIAEDVQPRLFQRFAQADESMTRRFGGTGLGLAICKQLVELTGGELGVSSKLGGGSLFWFTLPARAAEAPAQRRDASPENVKPIAIDRTLRILAAEDHAVNQRVLTTLLAAAGINVEPVTNGAEAVAAAQSREFDLILMDVQMPIMDGVQATRAIRTLGGRNAEIPIIALTAAAMAGDREQFLAAGMTDYLSKPINQPALLATIARHARRAESDAGLAETNDRNFENPPATARSASL